MLNKFELDQLDFEEILSDYGIRFHKVGSINAMFNCPFHGDSNPSCGMNVNTGLWGCFACGEKGNIIQFVEKMDDVDFDKAIETIRKKWITKTWTPEDALAQVQKLITKREEATKPKNTVIPDWTLNKFSTNYNYMYHRGFSDDTLRHFEVVYDESTNYQGIPIRNESGELIGISGRNTLDDDRPRYHPIIRYQKALVVFNLHRIHKNRPVIVTEGEINCMAMYQHGYTNSIALLGAGVAQGQIDILRNSQIKELVIFFDSDDAGQKGARKLYTSLWNYMRIRVVPDHTGDPDEMTKEYVDELVAAAKPFEIDFSSIKI